MTAGPVASFRWYAVAAYAAAVAAYGLYRWGFSSDPANELLLAASAAVSAVWIGIAGLTAVRFHRRVLWLGPGAIPALGFPVWWIVAHDTITYGCTLRSSLCP